MIAIYKYTFSGMSRDTLSMHSGAKILCLQMQNGVPCLWAQVDTSKYMENRDFKWYATGEPLPENPGEYIGTVQIQSFVYHLYEV